MASFKIKQKGGNLDKSLKALSKLTEGPKKLNVGLPKNSIDYPDGTDVIMVGAVHEFGSPARGIPERSFLRSTLQINKADFKATYKKLAAQVVGGKISFKKAMQLLVRKHKVKYKTELLS